MGHPAIMDIRLGYLGHQTTWYVQSNVTLLFDRMPTI
jgi:hypothetical protein